MNPLASKFAGQGVAFFFVQELTGEKIDVPSSATVIGMYELAFLKFTEVDGKPGTQRTLRKTEHIVASLFSGVVLAGGYWVAVQHIGERRRPPSNTVTVSLAVAAVTAQYLGITSTNSS